MTAIAGRQTDRITTTSDVAVRDMLDASTCLRRALELAGTRSCAHVLFEAADLLDHALPQAMPLLRELHPDGIPMHLRATLSMLRDATSRARELGSAASCVVPSREQSVPALICQLDEWAYSAERLVAELDR